MRYLVTMTIDVEELPGRGPGRPRKTVPEPEVAPPHRCQLLLRHPLPARWPTAFRRRRWHWESARPPSGS